MWNINAPDDGRFLAQGIEDRLPSRVIPDDNPLCDGNVGPER